VGLLEESELGGGESQEYQRVRQPIPRRTEGFVEDDEAIEMFRLRKPASGVVHFCLLAGRRAGQLLVKDFGERCSRSRRVARRPRSSYTTFSETPQDPIHRCHYRLIQETLTHRFVRVLDYFFRLMPFLRILGSSVTAHVRAPYASVLRSFSSEIRHQYEYK
jgi:hypothetical protein